MTAFPVTASSAELKVLLTKEPPEDLPKVEEPGFCQDVTEKADGMDSDVPNRVTPHAFQDLVAGILEATPFTSGVRPSPRDGPTELRALPDSLGFRSP